MSTLLLIHGRDSSKETFLTIVPELASRLGPDVTVVAIDLPGHGTDAAADAALAYADEAAFVRAVDARLALAVGEDAAGRPLTVLGHSMGARAAVIVAKHRPVHALIVEDMDMRPRSRGPGWGDAELAAFPGRFFESFAAVGAALAPFGYDAAWLERKRNNLIQAVPDAAAALPPPFLLADSAAPVAAAASDDTAWFVGTDPRVTVKAHELLLTSDHHDELEALVARGVKLHVILADRGSACAVSERAFFARLTASLTIVPKSNHSVHATNKAEFVDAVAALFRRNE